MITYPQETTSDVGYEQSSGEGTVQIHSKRANNNFTALSLIIANTQEHRGDQVRRVGPGDKRGNKISGVPFYTIFIQIVAGECTRTRLAINKDYTVRRRTVNTHLLRQQRPGLKK